MTGPRAERLSWGRLALVVVAAGTACSAGAPRPGEAPAHAQRARPLTAAGVASPDGRAEPPGPASNGLSRSSYWNQPLPYDAPLAHDSAAIVRNLVLDQQRALGAWPLMTDAYSAPIYIAPPDAPLTRWRYDNCSGASGLHPPFGDALAAVPTLPNMLASKGTDGELVVYQPSTDTYWDFWRASVDTRGRWSACWGGRILGYSESDGIFEPPLGATATGLALGAFLIRIDELRRGHIDHVVNFATIRTRVGCHSWPANRDDGDIDRADIACEGQRFRLDPAFDVETIENPAARVVARAMQRYGLVLTDKSDALITQAEDPRPYMARGEPNPYDELLGGSPWFIALSEIPVGRLQALPLDYGKDNPARYER